MPTPMPPTSVPAARRSAIKSAASWLSLVAATTAGLGPSSTLRTRVTADVADDLDGLRLVVHSYLPGQLGESLMPSAAEKPVASSQRAVTAAELRRGVIVDMVQPSHGSGSTSRPVVLAWLERGRPDLDYDARLARPVPGVPRGCAKTRGSSVELSASVMLAAS